MMSKLPARQCAPWCNPVGTSSGINVCLSYWGKKIDLDFFTVIQLLWAISSAKSREKKFF